MKKIYSKSGECKVLDAVDAREHLQTGRWFTEPVESVEPDPTIFEGMDGLDGGTTEIDPVSIEAYEQRQAEFQASQLEAESVGAEVLEEIKKSKSRGKK